jgi:ABC-type transport system involved in multi-copper enzyme maturation permease subunit
VILNMGRIWRLVAPFFIDPLSVKELSGISRRWQTYVGRGLYVGLIALIVWIFWSSLSARGRHLHPSAFAELSREIFIAFVILQMLVSTLGGMSAASDMVTREIRNGTLGILALTPLSGWRIAAGKWKAALVQTSTGILCGIPAFAICAYLGGIGLWEFAYSFTLSLNCAALGAAIGLWCSTLFRTGYVASTVSVVFLLIYCIAPSVLFATDVREETVLDILSWIHPLYSAIGAVGQGTMGKRMGLQAYGWMPMTLVVGLQVWILLRWSASRIRTLVLRSGGSGGTVASSAPSASREVRTSGFARFFRGGTEVWQHNAILWKELSTRRLGLAARIGLTILLFLLLTTIVDGEGVWRILLYWVSWIVMLLFSISAGVSLFVTEREERKWEVLLCTPLRAHEIVFAKLVAGMAGLAPMALLLAGFWALFELLFGVTLGGMFMNMVSLALMILLAYVLGAAASLHARTQRVAFSSAFGIMIGLLFVFPVLLLMLQSFAVFSRDREFAEFLIGMTNPAMYMAHVSGPLARGYSSYRGGGWQAERELELWPMFMVYLGLYGGLVSALVVWLIRRFDRAAGRS